MKIKVKLTQALAFSELGPDAQPVGSVIELLPADAEALVARGLAEPLMAKPAAKTKKKAD